MQRFFIFFLCAIFVISLVVYTIGQSALAAGILSRGTGLSTFYIICGISELFFIGVMLVAMKRYHRILSILYLWSVLFLGFGLYILIACVLLGLIALFGVLFSITIPIHTIGIALFLLAIFLVLLGIIRALFPKTRRVTIVSKKLAPLWQGKKIVQVSDFHLGLIWQEGFIQKVIALIQKENPDLVLIAGDIIDGPSFPYEKTLRHLETLRPTFGIYYTPGNHESYNQEPDIFYPLMKKYTRALIDEKASVNGTDIIGLDYKSETQEETESRLLQLGFTSEKPSIVILHDPKHAEVIQNRGASLIISGHTHKGQFWPITHIVKSIYKNLTYGVNTKNDSSISTSSGVGTAIVPMRLGSSSEIVVIEITS